MATPARRSKRPPHETRRPPAPAWTTRPSPAYSPGSGASSPNAQGAFPPLGGPPQAQSHPNGTRPSTGTPDHPHDRILQTLAGLTGITITISTKTAQRYEGVVVSTNSEGNTTGLTIKDVRDLNDSDTPPKDHLFIASTNIETWSSGPADVRVPNGAGDSFRTDTDISQKAGPRRDRELQAWQAGPTAEPTVPVPAATVSTGAPSVAAAGGGAGPGTHALPQRDEVTFGAGATAGSTAWDQFAVNEQLFGVKASFDEDVYTTKLDRSSADFKAKEKKAQKLADEIIGAATSNPHVAEERNMIVDDTGLDEEQRFGAVVRGPGAYVPPAARKTGTPAPAQQPAVAVSPGKQEIPILSVNGPDGASPGPRSAAPTTTSTPGTGTGATASAGANTSANAANKPPADPLPAFRDFVTNEKQRLTQKKQALFKSEMDKRMAELVKFSQSFKLNKPIPDDLVPILAKDEEKQRQIKEKSSKDAASAQARAIGASGSSSGTRPSVGTAAVMKGVDLRSKPVPMKTASGTPTRSGLSPGGVGAGGGMKTGKAGISMYIQPIPPFKGTRQRPIAAPLTAGAGGSGPQSSGNVPTLSSQMTGGSSASGPPMSSPGPSVAKNNSGSNNNHGNKAESMSVNVNRLNINASSFRPNPTAKAFNPVGGSSPHTAALTLSPKVKPLDSAQSATPNLFFGPRVKRSTPINFKDDFNPFRHNKVPEASSVGSTWPYHGKRHILMFPPAPQHPAVAQPHPSPHVMQAGPPPMPPPSYDDDQAAQAAAAARGYVYAYPPYGYPGQPMMPGMAPPGPPTGYITGHFMQPMAYPPTMPPNGQPMYAPGMGQMPPPQAYMPPPPPPGAYPTNGAAPRPSMPPTPIPAHAHPYYHQSPQLQHAVPYPMMMPPPAPNVPPLPYETGPAPPVPMPGVGHT